jgi:hypothetical protein
VFVTNSCKSVYCQYIPGCPPCWVCAFHPNQSNLLCFTWYQPDYDLRDFFRCFCFVELLGHLLGAISCRSGQASAGLASDHHDGRFSVLWAGSLQPSDHDKTRCRDSSTLACAGCLPSPEQSTPWVQRGHRPVPCLHSVYSIRGRFPRDSAQPRLCGLGPARSGHTFGPSLVVHAGCWRYDHVCRYIR